ncbi:DUF6457 domain-containing protein [uncultured Rothia sp.]|uniref:DUF6457 domain-containing protein n=1 Tax=uncultured Rothia sp. TaxID=316088 RepID=UPI00321759FC
MSKHEAGDLNRAQDFLTGVAQRLELDPAIVEETMHHLLGMTKHVAHDTIRPAAPLAAFLVGLAAGSAGESTAEGVHARIEKVEEAVKDFSHGQN